jgi:hypothetical protein
MNLIWHVIKGKTLKKTSISFNRRRSFHLVLLRLGQQVFNKTCAGTIVMNIPETRDRV